jgi:hypothetical protein
MLHLHKAEARSKIRVLHCLPDLVELPVSHQILEENRAQTTEMLPGDVASENYAD